MLRRLFFLFPDEASAQAVVDSLPKIGIKMRHVHAIARGIALETLPEATERQKKDMTFRVERILWSINIVLFFAALVSFLIMLPIGQTWLAAISLFIMIVCFIAGEQFVVRIPDVHLTEFTDALHHGEILLMIDVPYYKVAEVEDYVHSYHPNAVTGGVGWTMDAFGM